MPFNLYCCARTRFGPTGCRADFDTRCCTETIVQCSRFCNRVWAFNVMLDSWRIQTRRCTQSARHAAMFVSGRRDVRYRTIAADCRPSGARPLGLTPRKDDFALSPRALLYAGHPHPAAQATASSPAGCSCPSGTPRGTTSEAFCLTGVYTVSQSTVKSGDAYRNCLISGRSCPSIREREQA